jgi:hypothetical protein
MILLVFLDFQRRAVSGHPMTKSGTVASTAWKSECSDLLPVFL